MGLALGTVLSHARSKTTLSNMLYCTRAAKMELAIRRKLAKHLLSNCWYERTGRTEYVQQHRQQAGDVEFVRNQRLVDAEETTAEHFLLHQGLADDERIVRG